MKKADINTAGNSGGTPVNAEGPGQKGAETFVSGWKKRTTGSMTIEAALVLPLFLFFVTAILYFLVIISLQTDIQLAMEETARSLGKKAYFAEHTARTQASEEDGERTGILSAGINPLTIKAWMLYGGLGERINRSRIVGGVGGFYVYHSGYESKKGILDIVVNYTYQIPFLPEQIGKVRFVQRSRSHVWTGRMLKEGSGGGDASDGTSVYVTPHGTAYHLSKNCPYLDLSIHGMGRDAVDSARNKDGGKYYMCTDCCRKGESYGTVYVTDYGTNWHSDPQCTGLKRTVEEIDFSDAGSRHVCPKCGGSH